MGKIIAVLGFPKSGKSTWLSEEYRRLRAVGASFFVQRGCPDGEGQWTFESQNGKQLRVKGKFDEAFVNWVKQSAVGLSKTFDTVYLDCGGRQSSENRQILQICNEAVIIGRTLEDIESWLEWLKTVKPITTKTFLSSVDTEGSVSYQEVVLG